MELEFQRPTPLGSSGQDPTEVRMQIPFEIIVMIVRLATDRGLNFEHGGENDILYNTRDRSRLQLVETAKNLRRVNKVFNTAATPFLFREASIAPSLASIARLSSIVNHPSLARHVSTLYIDCHQYSEELLELPENYFTDLQRQNMWSRYAEEKVQEGVHTLRDILLEQRKCREDKLHARCLDEALPKLSGLSEIIFTEMHPAYFFRPAWMETRRGQMYRPEYAQYARYQHILAPEVNPVAQDRVLAQFVGVVAMRGSSPTTKSLKLCLWGTHLQMKAILSESGSFETASETLLQLFERLEKFSLDFSCIENRMLLIDDEVLILFRSVLKSCLTGANRLNTLYLQFGFSQRGEDVGGFSKLIMSNHFVQLRTLRLRGLWTQENKLLDFLHVHSETLRHVELDKIRLKGSWRSFVSSLKSPASLKLDHFDIWRCVEHVRDGDPPQLDRAHVSVRSSVLLDYLYNNGFLPFPESNSASEMWRRTKIAIEATEQKGSTD